MFNKLNQSKVNISSLPQIGLTSVLRFTASWSEKYMFIEKYIFIKWNYFNS